MARLIETEKQDIVAAAEDLLIRRERDASGSTGRIDVVGGIIRNRGRDRILQLLAPIDSGNVAQEITYYLEHLKGASVIEFIQAWSSMFVGTLFPFIPKAAFSRWNTSSFLDLLNNAGIGTPLPEIEMEHAYPNTSAENIVAQDIVVTSALDAALRRDHKVGQFFSDVNSLTQIPPASNILSVYGRNVFTSQVLESGRDFQDCVDRLLVKQPVPQLVRRDFKVTPS